jgi:lysophospholipase L1-like esterase
LALVALACREHPKIKPSRPARLMDGVMRVVVIGDSLAAGTGDETGKGIPGNLEDELKQRGISVVLSVGANNVFQDPEARARAIRDRDVYAQEILERVAGAVAQMHAINPDAELMLLGGYNPLPDHPLSGGISRYIRNWDKLINRPFESDALVDVVKTSDIIDSGAKLSAADHFHPGAAAYREIAKRIADMLVEQIKSV